MTKDEALKMALEALETNNKAWKHLADSGDAGFWEAEEQPFYELSVKAITAIKEALMSDTDGAQPEQETLAWEQFYPDIGKPQLAPPHPWEKFCDSNCVWTDHHPDCKLAQPEQDGKCKYCTDGCPACDARKLLEQKPVAWGMEQSDGEILDVITPEEHARLEGGYTVPLYRHPPQRTWVGLTLDERIELAKDVDWAIGAYCEYAEKIEAKLKEKNA